MIQALHLENYKSYSGAHIRFSEGLNAIVGETDSGKSGLLSAILWIMTNRPLGDRMQSDWGGGTNAALEVDEKLINRTKAYGGNTYSIVRSDGHHEIFKAIRSSIPNEIAAMLKMDEINYQPQHNPYFLLNMSPGEIGRFLNRVADLDIVARSVVNINTTIRQEDAEAHKLRVDLQRLEAELEEFKWLDEFESRVLELEKLESEIEAMRERLDFLNERVGRVRDLEKEREELLPTLEAKPHVLHMIRMQDEIGRLSTIKYRLRTLLARIKDLAAGKKRLEDKLSASKERFREEMPEVCPLCGGIT